MRRRRLTGRQGELWRSQSSALLLPGGVRRPSPRRRPVNLQYRGPGNESCHRAIYRSHETSRQREIRTPKSSCLRWTWEMSHWTAGVYKPLFVSVVTVTQRFCAVHRLMGPGFFFMWSKPNPRGLVYNGSSIYADKLPWIYSMKSANDDGQNSSTHRLYLVYTWLNNFIG